MSPATALTCTLCRDHAAVGRQYTADGRDALVCLYCAAPEQGLRPRPTAGASREPRQREPITRTMHAGAVRPPMGRR